MMKKILFVFCILLVLQPVVFGAVGCDLNDPDRDVKRFFPEMTNYKTEYFTIKNLGGDKLYEKIQNRYGAPFKGIYENIDVPYTVYTVLKGREIIGYIHGVNQKGKYGGLQVFLVLNPYGRILDQYFQKMTASYAGKFRNKSFSSQFKGLGLNDFLQYNVLSSSAPPKSKINQIKNSAPEAVEDFNATLRGVKKNLILMDEFVFNKGGRQK